jgi:hypothetical protein
VFRKYCGQMMLAFVSDYVRRSFVWSENFNLSLATTNEDWKNSQPRRQPTFGKEKTTVCLTANLFQHSIPLIKELLLYIISFVVKEDLNLELKHNTTFKLDWQHYWHRQNHVSKFNAKHETANISYDCQ